MDKQKQTGQEETTRKHPRSSGADFFGEIAPAAHADNQSADRQSGRGEKKARQHRPGENRRGPSTGRRRMLLVAAGLLLFFFAALYLIVPAVVQGPLARQAGQYLGCRLSVDRFSFSPFTLRFRGERAVLASTEGGKDEQPWFKAAVVSGRLQLPPLLRGRVRIEELRIDRPEVSLTRDRTGSYNLPFAPPELKKLFREGRLRLRPDILSFQISDGTFSFNDRLTGRLHRAEHVLYSPDGKDGLRFQAVINGSPVTLSRADSPGSKGTGPLHLQLSGMEIEPYLAYLPREYVLPVALSGRINGTLELIPSGTEGGRFNILGKLGLQKIRIADRQRNMSLKIPTARFSFELVLPEGRLLVRELVLREPDFVLSAEALPSLLREMESGPAKTVFQRLLIDQGRLALQAAGRTFSYKDLQVSLQTPVDELINRNSGAATFQIAALDARDPAGEVRLEGTVARGRMEGHLQVRGFDLARLSKGMGEDFGLSQLKGVGEVDSELVLQRAGAGKKYRLSFRNSRVQASGFHLQAGNLGTFSGKNLLCRAAEFSFADNSGRPLCDRLDLEQAEMTLPLEEVLSAFKNGSGEDLSSLFRDLEVKESIVHLTNTEKEELVRLERVLVQVNGMPGTVNTPGKIGLRAGLGESGQVRLSGTLTGKEDRLDFSLFDVRLTDLWVPGSWSPLPVQKGRLRGRGQLLVDEAVVTGDVVLDDVLAADESKGHLQLRQLVATGVTVGLSPLHIQADTVVLKTPEIEFQEGTDGFLFPFFNTEDRDRWWRDTVLLKKIILADGMFQSGREGLLPGMYPKVTTLQGTVEGWPSTPFSFGLNGSVFGGGLKFKGKWEGTGRQKYVLRVETLPLAPFAEEFLQSYGLVADDALMSWQLTITPDAESREYADCRIQNLYPRPGSPLEQTLAFLIDGNEEIALSLESGQEDSPRFLLERVVDALHRIRLRELVLPGSTVQEQQPFLELPEVVEFQAGLDTSDELFLLDDYVQLLKRRPHLRLVVAGGYDHGADGAVLQDVLQEEADARIEVENLRRQQERTRWLREYRRKTKTEISAGGSAEPVSEVEVPQELQPLPSLPVQVDPELLENLAGKRAVQVRRYLVEQGDADPDRIRIQATVRTGTAAVYLSLEPFFQAVTTGEHRKN